MDGFLPHSPTVRPGRAMLNEIFHVRPDLLLGEVEVPVLIVHGTADTFIPVERSCEAARRFGRGADLVEVVTYMADGVINRVPPTPLHLLVETTGLGNDLDSRLAQGAGHRCPLRECARPLASGCLQAGRRSGAADGADTGRFTCSIRDCRRCPWL